MGKIKLRRLRFVEFRELKKLVPSKPLVYVSRGKVWLITIFPYLTVEPTDMLVRWILGNVQQDILVPKEQMDQFAGHEL